MAHQNPKLRCLSSRLAVVFVQYIEARCSVKNEDVVGAVPTGDASTTSEWSTISLPTEVCLILEVLRYIWTNIVSTVCNMVPARHEVVQAINETNDGNKWVALHEYSYSEAYWFENNWFYFLLLHFIWNDVFETWANSMKVVIGLCRHDSSWDRYLIRVKYVARLLASVTIMATSSGGLS